MSAQPQADAAEESFRAPSAPSFPCPVCRDPMNPVEVSGVHIDICAAHGTWLDRGEAELLRKALAFGRAAAPLAEQAQSRRADAQAEQFAVTAKTPEVGMGGRGRERL